MAARNTSDLVPFIRIIPVIESETFEIDLEVVYGASDVATDIERGFEDIESDIADGYMVENAGDWGLLDDIVDDLVSDERESDWMVTLDNIADGLYTDRVENYDVIAANLEQFGVTSYDPMHLTGVSVTVYDDQSEYEDSIIDRHREAYGLDASYPADYIAQAGLDATSTDDATIDLPDGAIALMG